MIVINQRSAVWKETSLEVGCLVLLYHRLFEGIMSLDLGSQHRNTHPQGWRLFPYRRRTPIPALHMREMKGDAAVITLGAMPWGHQMHSYTREMHLLPANACRLLIKEAVVTNMQSLYPGCSLCLKCPLGSSLLGLLLFSALCSRSPPLRPLPCLHPSQRSPSPLLCADLGQLLQHAGLEWFIFLSRPDFQDSQRPLQGNTSPEKCPFPAKGAEVMTFLSFIGIWATQLGIEMGTISMTGWEPQPVSSEALSLKPHTFSPKVKGVLILICKFRMR